MGEVVQPTFGAKPKPDERELVWVCVCGCTNFHLHADGRTECCACELFSLGAAQEAADGSWRERLPPTPPADTPVETTARNFKVISIDTAQSFLRAKADLVAQARVVILVGEDGELSTWSIDPEGQAQRSWMERKVGEAVDMLVRAKCR